MAWRVGPSNMSRCVVTSRRSWRESRLVFRRRSESMAGNESFGMSSEREEKKKTHSTGGFLKIEESCLYSHFSIFSFARQTGSNSCAQSNLGATPSETPMGLERIRSPLGSGRGILQMWPGARAWRKLETKTWFGVNRKCHI